jgi:hypothetical protein
VLPYCVFGRYYAVSSIHMYIQSSASAVLLVVICCMSLLLMFKIYMMCKTFKVNNF